jgi:NIMA (never in mitosis gene a)-related kinase
MTCLDDFEIQARLGEGAYSNVYKVVRKTDKNVYALKKVRMANLSAKEKENALNEVRILASIKSPFIISYKECFID